MIGLYQILAQTADAYITESLIIRQIYAANFSRGRYTTAYFSELGVSDLTKVEQNIHCRLIIHILRAFFRFQIRCFVSKPERLTYDWGGNWRPHFGLFDPVNVGKMVEISESARRSGRLQIR